MSRVYFIMPVGSDPDFGRKRSILAQISAALRREFFFPFERHIGHSLDDERLDIINSSLVIADLSFERPSCYFELGVAQALEVPVFSIAADGTVLHQGARSDAVRIYSTLDQYRELINLAITSVGTRVAGHRGEA